MTDTVATFNPLKVKRIRWANGAEVVHAMDYDRLLEMYRKLLHEIHPSNGQSVLGLSR